MEKKSSVLKSPSRKKAAIKKLYSSIMVIGSVNHNGEFNALIREAIKVFKIHKIDQLYETNKGPVVDLAQFRKDKENL